MAKIRDRILDDNKIMCCEKRYKMMKKLRRMRKVKVSAAFKHFEKVVKKPGIEKEIFIKHFRHVPYGADYGFFGQRRIVFKALMCITAEMIQNRKNKLRRNSII